MRIWNMLLGTALMIGVIGATWMYAQQRRPAGTLSAEDYIEIQQLYYQYATTSTPAQNTPPPGCIPTTLCLITVAMS